MGGMQGHWLMSQETHKYFDAAYSNFEFDQVAYEAFIQRVSSSDPGGELFVRDGGTARILIEGVLTKQPDFFFDIFGPGSAVYGDIVRAIEAADADDSVDLIVLEIDSRGGEVAGFFETGAAIANTTTPTEAQITDLAASGAFGLASQADSTTVNNSMALVGSIGVATSVFVSENRIQIASTAAPKKRPDASTEEGVAIIREELDAIHAEFAGIIARGRGVSVETVNADFGQGGMLIAADALRASMIDGINAAATDVGSGSSSGNLSTEIEPMTLEELKAQHPALFASIHEAGVKIGVANERDRVTAHAEAGKACGHPEIALAFIESGEDYSSQKVQAKYNTAHMTGKQIADRAADDADARTNGAGGKTTEGGTKPDEAAQTNEIFDMVETNMGLDRTQGV